MMSAGNRCLWSFQGDVMAVTIYVVQQKYTRIIFAKIFLDTGLDFALVRRLSLLDTKEKTRGPFLGSPENFSGSKSHL